MSTWEQKFVKEMEKWARNLTENIEKVLREFGDRIEEIDVKSTPICGAKVTVGTMTVECGKARFHPYPHDWDNTSDVSTQVRDVDIAGANFQAAHEEIENLEASIEQAKAKPGIRCASTRGDGGPQCVLHNDHEEPHFDGMQQWTDPSIAREATQEEAKGFGGAFTKQACNRERMVRYITRRCEKPLGHEGEHVDQVGSWSSDD